MSSEFIYRDYKYKITGGNLEISFFFEIPPDIQFHPSITIKNETRPSLVSLDNLVFHLGMAEIPSYWKATCAKEIVIEAGYLNKEQIKWWQDLITKGMGQFFYENKLPFIKPKIIIKSTKRHNKTIVELRRNNFLVPIGGGRDSIVTLEKLKSLKKQINCFVVNPTKIMNDVLRVGGIKEPIIVERIIDPRLLGLNKKGYYNGHTPFTAVLSFLSVFCAVLFDYKNIAFSNEKSANEGNVKYRGRMVNHQYSKSYEFERKFKDYCGKYLVKNLNYFSYLRKYTDLEISKIFSKYPEYFSVFSSCNAGRRINKKWCNNCPKCLFVYLTLCPYLEKKELLKIFGENLLEKKNLTPILKSLTGQGTRKPFECVGTYKESKKALELCIKRGLPRETIIQLKGT